VITISANPQVFYQALSLTAAWAAQDLGWRPWGPAYACIVSDLVELSREAASYCGDIYTQIEMLSYFEETTRWLANQIFEFRPFASSGCNEWTPYGARRNGYNGQVPGPYSDR
jgi:hypothetical protein